MGIRLRQLLLLVMVLSLAVFTVKAQDDEDSSVSVQFDGHSFALPRDLANGFSAFVVDAPTEIPGGDIQPPRTEFRLQLYTNTVDTSPAVGWVNVYDVGVLEGYAQYAQLRDLLSERPDLSTVEALPTLYPYQRSALPTERYTEFFVNAAYLETAAYQGITFIYGRVIHVANSQSILFYRVYFEGISLDEQRYLSAQVEGLPSLTAPLEGITAPDEYLAQAKVLFGEPTDEAVIAWLTQANSLFASFDYGA